MTYTTGISDLINREVLKKRVRTTRDLIKKRGAHPEILERITLFATFRCNMACPYCQTIRHNTPDPETEFSIDQFCHLLDTFAQTPIRHIHFTGGEATLNPDLEAMIKESTRRGILCSLTTNGLAPLSIYERLIEEGLCEIRISCDSVVSNSDRPNPFSRDQQNSVMRRIEELVQFKKSRKQSFTIIVNSCVSHDNRIDLADQVVTMTALNPDDVKLIPISYESPSLGFFSEREDIIKRIKEHLASFHPNHFSLLRSKLTTVFASDTWGFRDWTSSRLMQHCYLPLTERTITGKGYYPCPVYVREGGTPLGKFGESFLLQHERVLEFFKGDSCREDPICLNNCVNCIKRFNLLANAVIGQSVIGKTGKREPVTHLIETGEKERVTDREVWDRIEQIRKIKKFGIHPPGKQHSLFYDDRIMGASPFIIIKPGGMPYQHQTLNFF